MSRKRFSERQVLETLLFQGVVIRCFRTKEPFTVERIKEVEREHLHEIALGGPDIPANCRYSFKSTHSIVTNGTKATSAGSSKHRIRKAARIARGGKTKRGRSIPSRPFAKRPKK